MNRRDFFKKFGIGVGIAVIAPKLLVRKEGVFLPPDNYALNRGKLKWIQSGSTVTVKNVDFLSGRGMGLTDFRSVELHHRLLSTFHNR